jgi:hypothetical protein
VLRVIAPVGEQNRLDQDLIRFRVLRPLVRDDPCREPELRRLKV